MCVKYRGISKIGMCEMYTIQLNLEMPHKSIKKIHGLNILLITNLVSSKKEENLQDSQWNYSSNSLLFEPGNLLKFHTHTI